MSAHGHSDDDKIGIAGFAGLIYMGVSAGLWFLFLFFDLITHSLHLLSVFEQESTQIYTLLGTAPGAIMALCALPQFFRKSKDNHEH